MPIRLPDNAVVGAPDEQEPQDPIGGRGNSALPGGISPTIARQAAGIKLPEAAVASSTPSIGERAAAFGQGAFGAFSDALPLAGAASGAVLGAGAGSPTGPGALATGAAGMALGAGAGYSAKGALDAAFDVPAVEDMPEELRPYGYSGEAFGGSVPVMGVPYAAASQGVRLGVRFIDRIIETVARRPGATALAELSATAGGATAEGLSEAAFPGETGVRIGAGVAGSVLAPGQVALAGTDAAKHVWRSAAQALTESGRNTAAANELSRILSETGEDPKALAGQLRALELALPRGAEPTAAQLSNSPGLLALESELRRRNAQFGREAADQASSTMEVLRRTADALSASGDPALVREAAQARRLYFDALLSSQLSAAEQKAVQAAQRLGPDEAGSVSDLSRRATELLDESLRAARAQERALWGRVPGHAPATASTLFDTFDSIRDNDLLPDEQMPGLAARFVNRLRRPEETAESSILDAAGRPLRPREQVVRETPTTVRELQLFRSRMLEEARRASAEGNYRDARIYGQLAESALDDMGEAGGEALEVARDYSRALNDVYSRSFAGTATAEARTGARRVPPEIMLRRATGTGQEIGALRLQELQRAVQFGSPEAADELLGMQEQFLRNAADTLVNPNTGRITSLQLARFRRRNREILQQFPELREQLQSTADAEAFFATTQNRTRGAERAIDSRAAFARVAQSENPVAAVSRVLAGGRPQEDFRQLAVLARRDSPEAVAGLQRAVMEDATQRATGANGFSFRRLEQNLFEPRRPGQPSSVEMMRRTGVMSADTEQRLRSLLDQAEQIESAINSGERLDDLLENESALFDLTLRIIGAKAGTTAASASGNTGTSLIAASAGSRFARQVLDRVPTTRVQDVLIEAAKDPQFMAALLEKGKTPAERIKIGTKLNAYLWATGLVRAPEDLTDE